MAERVLVVDDEKSIRRVVEYALEEGGFEVLSAGRGDDALEIIEKEPVDLVVLDLMLPHMNGEEVCRQLRADRETAAIPVLMLTAKGEPTDRIAGLEAGADDYLSKPFSPRELILRAEAIPVTLALMAAGRFSIELGDRFALDEAADAQRASEAGAPGKLLIVP